MHAALNVILFQVGWFSCVLLAARGEPHVGPIVVIAILLSNLLFEAPHRRLTLLFFAIAVTVAGSLVDSIGYMLGAFSFPGGSTAPWAYPIWMSALWLNFATVVGNSLSWLRGKYALAAALGAIGGPISYFGGAQFGAITVSTPDATSYGIIAALWMLATPASFYLHQLLADRGTKSLN